MNNIKNYQLSIFNFEFDKPRKLPVFTSLIITAAMLLTGCAGFLEDSTEVIVPRYITPYEQEPIEQIVISSFEEYEQLLLEFIRLYESNTTIRFADIENDDIQDTVSDIASNLIHTNAIAAYAVSDITVTAIRTAAYFEVETEIEFGRTAEQIQGIINASTQRYMITQLLEKMSSYAVEAVFHTNMQPEIEDIVTQVTELYYQNPRRVVMMPFVTVEEYPERNEETDLPNMHRIYEIRFGYTEDTDMLRDIGRNLDQSVRQNAARADGDNDGEILLSLVRNLIAGAEYDEGTAASIAMHGPQNIAATAFGALVRGVAVGEGFAMAFKALCDELRLECRIVLGYRNELYHAWNIVALDGDYYHIDTAVCASEVLEAGFLKRDSDFAGVYSWDTGNTPRCEGLLTIEDLLPYEDSHVTDDPNGNGSNSNPGNTATPDSGSGSDPDSTPDSGSGSDPDSTPGNDPDSGSGSDPDSTPDSTPDSGSGNDPDSTPGSDPGDG